MTDQGAVRRVLLTGCGVVVWACGGGVGQPGTGVRVKDLQRVEQVRGDGGGLSKSLAVGPAELRVPGDFSGVYKVPEEFDSPYAGWFARVQGGLIAVFPRGEYIATPVGMMAKVPANTRYFFGKVPGERRVERRGGTLSAGVERVEGRADLRVGAVEPVDRPVRGATGDAPLPPTVESARTLDEVRRAVGLLCGDPVYRANRLRELVGRAGEVE